MQPRWLYVANLIELLRKIESLMQDQWEGDPALWSELNQMQDRVANKRRAMRSEIERA